MYCKNCGQEIPDDSTFCSKCGAKVQEETLVNQKSKEEQETLYQQSDELVEDKKGTGAEKRIFLWIIVFLLLLIIVGGCVILFSKSKTNVASVVQEEVQRETKKDAYPIITGDKIDEVKDHDLEGLYQFNLEAMDHQPGRKSPGMEWDSDLFYQLEGIGGDDINDVGLLSKCALSQFCLWDTASNSEIACEVYSDPVSGQIYKISSLKKCDDDSLDIIDYYYKDGKPYFVFWRDDSVYTPSYASLKIAGTRFYFEDDILVLVRTVMKNSLQVSQTGLKVQGRSDYEEFDYFDSPVGVAEQYDAYELEWLNRSYNTYEAIASSPRIGKLAGTVKDDSGDPVVGHRVVLQNQSNGEIVCSMQTDVNGQFAGYIYQDGKSYQLYIEGADEYQDLYVHEISTAQNTYGYLYNYLVLLPKNKDVRSVRIQTLDATTKNSQSGSQAAALKTQINIREGSNTHKGEVIYSGSTDENGELSMSLPCGNYTLEAIADGYETSWMNLMVTSGTDKKEVYLIPALSNGESAFVLTWKEDSDADLDLMMFTPYASSDGNMAYISQNSRQDSFGNYLVCDNTSGCEVIYGKLDSEKGMLKAYVSNYSAFQDGNKTTAWEDQDIHLYVYQSGGRVTEYMPEEAGGMVWEAAAIRNDTVLGYDRFYSRIDGKPWWQSRKGEFELTDQDLGIFEGLSYNLFDRWVEGRWSRDEFVAQMNFSICLECMYACGGLGDLSTEQYCTASESGTEYGKYVVYGAFDESARISNELFGHELRKEDFETDSSSTLAGLFYNERYQELVNAPADIRPLGDNYVEFVSLDYDQVLNQYLVKMYAYGYYEGFSDMNITFYITPTSENSFGYKILEIETVLGQE